MIENASAVGHLLAQRLEAFGRLSGEDKASLLNLDAEARRIPAGRDIYVEGSRPEGAFVIVEGFACRYKLLACGTRHITAYLLPGDLCDLDVSLLDQVDQSVGALTACLVAFLSTEVLEHLLQRRSLARALRLIALAENANTREWLVNVGRRRAPARVAHLLCEILARLRAVGLVNENSYNFPLTQNDLADAMGMSTVHMNRALQELRGRGLIEFRRGRLTICDLPVLQTFAQFNSGYLYLDYAIAA